MLFPVGDEADVLPGRRCLTAVRYRRVAWSGPRSSGECKKSVDGAEGDGAGCGEGISGRILVEVRGACSIAAALRTSSLLSVSTASLADWNFDHKCSNVI